MIITIALIVIIASMMMMMMMTTMSRCKAEGNSLLVDPGQLSIVARRARQSLLDVQVVMMITNHDDNQDAEP